MRSFVVCALLLAFAAAAQAGAVKTRRSEVQYSCDIKGIANLVKDVIADSIAVVFDVKADIDGISNGVLNCVFKDLFKPETLVDCVINTVETDAKDAINTVRTYVSKLESSLEEIKSKVHQCTKI